MYILGINSAYHESSACLLQNGIIIAAVEEERFTRRKHAKSAQIDNPDELPLNAIHYCLNTANICMKDIGYIGFSLNPQKRLENQQAVDIVEEGNWGSRDGEALFFKKLCSIPDILKSMGFDGEFMWLDHHVCHAASAYYPSPFAEAAILAIDGIGEVTSTAFAYGRGSDLTVHQEMVYPNSLGFLWEKISQFLGFSAYDATKVMGLAAYGNSKRFRSQYDQLVQPTSDGMCKMDGSLLRFRIDDFTPLEELFEIKKRNYKDELEDVHQDIAAALQEVTNVIVLHMVKHLYDLTKSENLCVAGGVALNCVTNRIMYENGPFRRVYIQPAAHDAGTALGASYYIWNSFLKQERRETMVHAYWGPAFSSSDITHSLIESGLPYEYIENIEVKVAELLSQGNIVGWFQGRLEFGPRALGNRSLLADPRHRNMREILNRKVKHREVFRPLAPSVLTEEVDKWFTIKKSTPASDFMLIAYPARDEKKDEIPAVIHVDNTSRVQTVSRETNSRYHSLITAFFKITGVPMVLNTSFNESEPIVCTPQNALNTFIRSGIDYLAIDNFLVSRPTKAL
jgi:carbamoyltransferase